MRQASSWCPTLASSGRTIGRASEIIPQPSDQWRPVGAGPRADWSAIRRSGHRWGGLRRSLTRLIVPPGRIRRRTRMKSKAPGLILTKSQAACLAALQHHKTSKTEIAMQAKLDLRKTAIALDKLEELGLARRGETNTWRTTRRGRICRFEIVSDRVRRNGAKPGPGARRLLELLDQPMRGSELAERLGVTIQ